IGSERIAAGEILTASSELISVEAVDYNGNALNSATTLVPTSFELHQNFPNPFNPSTKISFEVPSASEYTVTIYNVAGQKVHEITGSAGSAGTVLVEWNASNQASGIYFYNVKTDNASATKKMVLLKSLVVIFPVREEGLLTLSRQGFFTRAIRSK
ncbi:MAG: T9SS type A sorting domain-containing protein, partial [candidate division Zixibacteria bacterium]|nr:T9SS type A sorting domain-containing protein [candidate division Zixibacteria bacterium]